VGGDFRVGRAFLERGDKILRPKFHEVATEQLARLRAITFARFRTQKERLKD
jgi:hypothetical protein